MLCAMEYECGYKMNKQTNDGTHTHTHTPVQDIHTYIHIKRFKVSHKTNTHTHISWRASQRIRSITTIKFKTHTKWCEWRCEWRQRRKVGKWKSKWVELKMLFKQPRPEFHQHNGKRAKNSREKIKMKIDCSWFYAASALPVCLCNAICEKM